MTTSHVEYLAHGGMRVSPGERRHDPAAAARAAAEHDTARTEWEQARTALDRVEDAARQRGARVDVAVLRAAILAEEGARGRLDSATAEHEQCRVTAIVTAAAESLPAHAAAIRAAERAAGEALDDLAAVVGYANEARTRVVAELREAAGDNLKYRLHATHLADQHRALRLELVDPAAELLRVVKDAQVRLAERG